MNKKLHYGIFFILIFSLSISLSPAVGNINQPKFSPENQINSQLTERIVNQDIQNTRKRGQELTNQVINSLDTKKEEPLSIPWKEDMLDFSSILETQLAPNGASVIEEVVEQTESSTTTKFTFGEDFTLYHSRSVQDSPKMKVIQEDGSIELNDIIVPVLDESEIHAQKLTGTHVEKRKTTIGIEYQTELTVHNISYDLGNCKKKCFRFTFIFEYRVIYHITFPLEITIEHPQAVAPEQQYSLDVTINAQDHDARITMSLDYDIKLKLDYNHRYGVDRYWFKIWYWCFWCSPFPGKFDYFWMHKRVVEDHWQSIIDTRVGLWRETMVTNVATFTTPIGNRLSLYTNPTSYIDVIQELNSIYYLRRTWSLDDDYRTYAVELFQHFKEQFGIDSVLDLVPFSKIGLHTNLGFIGDKKLTAQLGVYKQAQPSDPEETPVESPGDISIEEPFWTKSTVQWGGKDSDNGLIDVTRTLERAIYSNWAFTDLEDYVENYNDQSDIVDREATKSLSFSLPRTGGSNESVRFAVEKLLYYPGHTHIKPRLSIQLGGLLPPFIFPYQLPNPVRAASNSQDTLFSDDFSYSSDFYYSTMTSIDTGNYDFEVVGVTAFPYGINGSSVFDQKYGVTLRSLGDRDDFIDLAVEGLEQYPGVTVSFDRNPASYDISPYRPEPLPPQMEQKKEEPLKLEQEEPSKGAYVPDGFSAEFTIHIPDRTNLPAGPFNFTLVATSKGKDLLSLPDKSLRKTFQVQVPDIVDLQFTPPQPWGTLFQVNPEEVLTLDYSGQNHGNMADNFTIQAILHKPESSGYKWNNTHTVSRYTEGSQNFNGQFTFNYTKSEFYPVAGSYSLDLIATSQQNSSFSKHLTTYIVDFLPDYIVTSSITPDNVTMFADYNLEFLLMITNEGNEIDSYTITADGWTTYLNYTTRLENLTIGETRVVPVRLKVPDPSIVPVQQYQFRMIIRSEGSNQSYSIEEVSVNFLEPDLAPPAVNLYQGDTLVYPLSNLSLGPSWQPIDENPDSYSIEINGIPFMNGTWLNGTVYTVPLKDYPGYQEGIFNVTAVFTDTSGNIISDTVWIDIVSEDQIAPNLGSDPYISMKIAQSIGNVTLNSPINQAYPITLNWAFDEDHLLHFGYYLNGTLISYENYIIQREDDSNHYNLTHTVNPGTLSAGVWNFTLAVSDMNGHNVSKSLFLEVLSTDLTLPNIIAAPQNTVNQGMGEFLSFVARDAYPHHWEVLVDGTVQLTGTWQNDIPAYIPVDELSLILGINNLELQIFDLSANVLQHQWTLILLDISAPEIVYSPDNFIGYEHNISLINTPYWIVTDSSPSTYTIYQNESVIESGVWSNYNNTIEILLTVRDIIAPSMVPLLPINYEPYYMANWFELHVNEKNPDSYELYRNETLIDDGVLTPYYQTVLVDLEFLSVGHYDYKLVMTDKFGNSGIGKVTVLVLDYTPPSIVGPALVLMSENSLGNLTWTIFERNPLNYTLYQNRTQIHNDTLVATGELINVTYQVGPLELGVYEYVLTVRDIIAPSMVPLLPINYEPYYMANWFELHVNEKNP
ncbi:MAG: COG1470 family protein, partial [Candidatus Kariarchaeaceae archaeon]